MKNHWLNRRFREGTQVRYKGFDMNLNGKIGKIKKMYGGWVDVEIGGRVISVEKDNLEIIPFGKSMTTMRN